MGKEEPRNSVESILGNIEREASIRLAGARKALAAGPGRELIALYNRGAAENSKLLFPVRLEEKEDHLLLKLDSFLAGILKMFLDQTPAGQAPAGQIAYCFHYSLALAMLESALIIGYWAKLWEDPGNPLNNKIIIGGGVFQNKLLTEILLHLAGKAGLGIYFPVKLPAGDGGLALGQVLIADKA